MNRLCFSADLKFECGKSVNQLTTKSALDLFKFNICFVNNFHFKTLGHWATQ